MSFYPFKDIDTVSWMLRDLAPTAELIRQHQTTLQQVSESLKFSTMSLEAAKNLTMTSDRVAALTTGLQVNTALDAVKGLTMATDVGAAMNAARHVSEPLKLSTPALEAAKLTMASDKVAAITAALDAVKNLAIPTAVGAAMKATLHVDTSAIDWAKTLGPQLDVAAAIRSPLVGRGLLDEMKDISDLTAQWRGAFDFAKIASTIPEGFGSINRLAETLRVTMPTVPAFDPALLGGAWNATLADAVARLRARAERVASDPAAGFEDVAALVADVEAVSAAATPEARNRLNPYLIAVLLWLLDKAAEVPAKALMHNALAVLILVLSTVVSPTPPPRPALPVPEVVAPVPLPSDGGSLAIQGGWEINGLPEIIRRAGPKASHRTLEFFTANIRNANTRQAYAHAVMRFFNWCDDRNLELGDITPFAVAAYIEELQREASPPTVKQHLAAIRMLFDWLVVGQVLPMNPASSVRGPRHVVKRGKTSVLAADQARLLLDSIDVSDIIGLRDRALAGLMVYSFARVSAAVGMKVEDYYPSGKRWWFRLHEKGGKRHEVPAHHNAEAYLDAYLKTAGIEDDAKGPLFRTIGRNRQLTRTRMHRLDVLRMIYRRATAAGLDVHVCCHTFRATGITAYLENGGTIEKAQQIAAHASPRTTKLYDRTNDELTLDEIERIVI
jgi:site-specific recombinase XerD